MNYWKNFLQKMKKHLGQIPYIIFSPFAIIIQLLYELIVTPYNVVCERINKDTFVQKRTERILQRTVSSVLHGHSNLLNTFQNRRIAKLFTFLLQCISFITTYAGFTFFLGPVNPIAPLFMAITVQGACFYLLNYTSSKKHSGSWKRNLLLAILITISTLTSYMGIFDSVVKPVDQMSVQYNNYVKIVNNLIDNEIEMNYSYDISYRDIEKIFNQFKTTLADADAVIDILNNANNQTKTTQTVPISWVDENNIVRYGTKTIPLEEASNTIVENKTQVSILTNYKTKISDYLSKEFSVSDILMSINSILNDPEKLNSATDNDKEIYNQFVSTIDVLNQLNGSLSGEDNSQIVVFNIEIDKAIENAQKRNELYELYLVEYDSLISEKGVMDSLDFTDNESKFLSTVFGFIEKLNKFVVSEELTEAEKIREVLVKTSEKSYANLYPLLSQHNKEELIKYNNYTIYENTQIMPFTAPFKQGNGLFGEALFSFAVAFLVDALSILISWL